MSYCEDCGAKIPDGHLYCEDCKEKRNVTHEDWKVVSSAPPPVEPPQAPAAEKAKAGVKLPLLLPAILILLAAAFFVVALLMGSKARPNGEAPLTLQSWSGAAQEEPVSPGPEELFLEAPDALSLRDNPLPDDPSARHRYEVVVGPYTWLEALEIAYANGGYLATITTDTEYIRVSELANQVVVDNEELRYIWVGGVHDGNDWCWITGEEWNGVEWYPGEPSGYSESGEAEDALCMWRVADGGWTFNDSAHDTANEYILERAGFIIEYDE